MKIEYRLLNHITIAVPAGEHDKVRPFYGGVLLHLEFTPPWARPAQNPEHGVIRLIFQCANQLSE
jgi:hypothetical protein